MIKKDKKKENRIKSSPLFTTLTCYNLSLSNRAKEKPCIGFIQENSIEFQIQSVYLIYTWLIVHTILNLVYSKNIQYDIIVLKPSM